MTTWQPSISQHQLRESDDYPERFTRQDWIQYSAVAGLAIALLLIARLLRPSAEGVGTHQQLGLPPCAFLHFTGLPCPSCGLTTSVSHAAHFHFYESLFTQPFGFVIFILVSLSVPLSIYAIYRRIPWSKLASFRGRKAALYLMIVVFLLSWLYKIAAMKSLIPHG